MSSAGVQPANYDRFLTYRKQTGFRPDHFLHQKGYSVTNITTSTIRAQAWGCMETVAMSGIWNGTPLWFPQ